MAQNPKLEAANVVAALNNQMDADGAVQGLRIVGFGDDQIGYLVRDTGGRVIDLLGRAPLVLGAVVGAILAGGLGLLVTWSVTDGLPNAIHLPTAHSPGALYLTGAVIGVIVGAFAGALCARGAWGANEVRGGPRVEPGRFVITVNAGDHRDQARAVIRHAGGHEMTAPTGAGMPA